MLRATFAISLILFSSGAVFAQQGAGTISGIVTDSQNAVVAGASVQVTHAETGQVFRTKTNESGFYTAPGLAVGAYEVVVEMKGFERTVRTGITLQVNQNAQVNDDA